MQTHGVGVVGMEGQQGELPGADGSVDELAHRAALAAAPGADPGVGGVERRAGDQRPAVVRQRAGAGQPAGGGPVSLGCRRPGQEHRDRHGLVAQQQAGRHPVGVLRGEQGRHHPTRPVQPAGHLREPGPFVGRRGGRRGEQLRGGHGERTHHGAEVLPVLVAVERVGLEHLRSPADPCAVPAGRACCGSRHGAGDVAQVGRRLLATLGPRRAHEVLQDVLSGGAGCSGPAEEPFRHCGAGRRRQRRRRPEQRHPAWFELTPGRGRGVRRWRGAHGRSSRTVAGMPVPRGMTLQQRLPDRLGTGARRPRRHPGWPRPGRGGHPWGVRRIVGAPGGPVGSSPGGPS